MDLIITLVVKSSCVNDFLLNSSTEGLTSSDFTEVPSNTEYSYCKKNVNQFVSAEGLITIENTNEEGYFQLGILSKGGSSGTCSYGYFSDYHEYAYAEFNMGNTYCVGNNITFNYESENVENLTLILPNGTTMTQPPFVLTNAQISQSGIYQLQGESCNGVQILDEIDISIEDCIIPDISLPDNIDMANCVFFPTSTEWGIEVGWSSESIISNLNIPLVGDLDNDGNPEIICFSKAGQSSSSPYADNQILVFDGVTKQLKTTITMSSPVTAYDAAAYGMVKLPSGKGLIVTACYDFKLRAYDITASDPNTPFWISDVDYGSNYGDWSVNVSFADFNADGHPEVYVRNKIYSAETGALLVSTTGSENTGASYCHWTHLTNYKLSTPMAADMCNDAKLELILGNEIYKVNITNPYGSSGNTISLERQVTPPNGVPNDGNVQVADFNADGYLDVFVSVRNTKDYSGIVYGYVWDVHNDFVSNALTINTSWSGKSIPMIADIDNDGLMEVLIQSGVSNSNEKFQAYKYNPNNQAFTLLWGFGTDEDSYSNSITSFDFNQDGLLELMICDQSTVRIVNGSGYSHITGNDTIPLYVMSSFPFSEITIMQYPIIVDVDADGNAEIVSVGSDKLNIFESARSPWAPARKVWNQYMYNVTNVNQDLTIPRYLFNNATLFTAPDGVARRPFNNFLQQATTIDQYGRPFYAVPDVAALSADITSSGANATLNVTYINQGDNALNAPYYITVFANQLDGTVVQTITVNTSLPVGETEQQNITLPMSVLCQQEDLTALVVAINCNGGSIAQDDYLQPECDITNNTAQVSINLQPDPTDITESTCGQYVWYGQTYTQSGQYEITIPNTYGCDSLLVLHLTILGAIYHEFEQQTCLTSFTWNGYTYYEDGDYEQTLMTNNGCDSIVTMHLKFVENYNMDITENTCEDSFVWNGIEYLESGVYQQTFVSTAGCDSIVSLHLNMYETYEVSIDTISCGAYKWGEEWFTESGDYRSLFTSSNGCDSLVNLHLTVGIDPIYSIQGLETLYVATAIMSGMYHYYIDSTGINPSRVLWSIDRDDWLLIPHGASCDLMCLSEGQGLLRAWTEDEPCNIDTTLLLNATFFDVGEEEALLKLYPNPTQGKITVEWAEIREINIYDLLGQKLMVCEYGKEQTCVLDLSRFQHGVYVLEILSSTGRAIRPVVLTQ
jgi:hypothetical protein